MKKHDDIDDILQAVVIMATCIFVVWATAFIQAMRISL